MRRDSTPVNHVNTILNFSNAFETEYNDKFVATRIIDIVRDMMSSGFPTELGDQSYYRYTWVAKIMLTH